MSSTRDTLARTIAQCAEPGRDGRWARYRVRECANRLRADGASPLLAAMCARAAANVGAAIRRAAGGR